MCSASACPTTHELDGGQAIIWAQKSPETSNHDVGEIEIGDIWVALPEDPSEGVMLWVKYSNIWDVVTPSFVAEGPKATISYPKVPQLVL